MELAIQILILIVSLVVLIKGAGWFVSSAETIGYGMGVSPFVVGVVIVGVGTSLPEMVSSVVAVLAGASEIVGPVRPEKHELGKGLGSGVTICHNVVIEFSVDNETHI